MKFILAAAALTASSLALAHNCPTDMKAIDAKLAGKPQMSATDMNKVISLRADGEKFHKEGKHDQSMAALSSAKKLLGI